jgi:hypothetical protein
LLWLFPVAACDLVVPPIYDLAAPGHADVPAAGVETACADACLAHAKSCSHRECVRGCNLVLDRLVERQGDAVVDCVARARPRCDDRAWARCAARIGPYADGGPPAPKPPSEDEPIDEEP